MRSQITTPFSRPTRRILIASALTVGALGLATGMYPISAQNTAPAGASVMAADTAYAAAKSGAIILVDIRRPDEWQSTGIAEGAIALDMREESFVASLVSLRNTYPNKQIALICRTGNRSGNVVAALAAQNFPGLVDVSEGMVGGRNGQGWIARGLPIYAGTADEIIPRLEAVIAR